MFLVLRKFLCTFVYRKEKRGAQVYVSTTPTSQQSEAAAKKDVRNVTNKQIMFIERNIR